jgi:2-iminoacetate synthase
MSLCKSRQILNCCHPNALMTLKEFLMDYGSDKTRQVGDRIIREQLDKITNEAVKKATEMNLSKIEKGERDFHF